MFKKLIKSITKRADYLSLKHAITNFKGLPILVIGDLMLDEYVWGEVNRISPEAPVPVVVVKEESLRLGGAANVAHNLKALGAEPILCGVVGDDYNGRKLVSILKDLDISTDFLLTSKERPTTVKTRIIARSQQVVRLDREMARPLSTELQEGLLSLIKDAVDNVKGAIISDYKKGVVVRPFVEKLLNVLKEMKGALPFISVDPKTGNFESYIGVDILTPNLQEAESFCHFPLETQEDLKRAYYLFKDSLGIKYLLITQGAEGMTLFEEDRMHHIPTAAKKVFDVTGAGDTVISTLTLAHVSGLNLLESAVLANIAAGIVVAEVGTSAVKAQDLIEAVESIKPQIPKSHE